MQISQKIKYLILAISNLSQLSHTEDCQIDFINDGFSCVCGYDDAYSGLQKLLKYYEERVEVE